MRLAFPSIALVVLSACGDPEPEPFVLRFAIQAGGEALSCTAAAGGFGPGGAYRVGLNDARFYVSNLRFLDEAGEEIESTLDESEFQYVSSEGSVALIDLTGNTEGSCAGDSIGAAEGTARVNDAVRGRTVKERVAGVAFDVGVPQAVMKRVIATKSAEGAPSPLNEMYWSWVTGYRHLVLNFVVEEGAEATGAGYVHVGSRDCGPQGGNALSDRDRCAFVNTPTVVLRDFDLEADRVVLDLRPLLAGVNFRSPIYDENFEVIGEGPGVECHSHPMQPHCAPLFAALGLDAESGAAIAAANEAFLRGR